MVRQEQGPSPTPPEPRPLQQDCAPSACAQVGEPETQILCRAMAPEQVGSGYLSRERMETLEEWGSSR